MKTVSVLALMLSLSFATLAALSPEEEAWFCQNLQVENGDTVPDYCAPYLDSRTSPRDSRDVDLGGSEEERRSDRGDFRNDRFDDEDYRDDEYQDDRDHRDFDNDEFENDGYDDDFESDEYEGDDHDYRERPRRRQLTPYERSRLVTETMNCADLIPDHVDLFWECQALGGR